MVNEINVKTILNKNKKGDDWFLGNYTLNPYAGCTMACIYCYTRGSKYGGDYKSVVYAKTNAVPVLKRQLKNSIRRDERGVIILGFAADPYPSIEQELNLTREILGIIKRYKFPIHILTKSKLIVRDMDILNGIKSDAILPDELSNKLDNGVIISFSLSTLDEKLAKVIEPGAPSPIERLEIMKKFSAAGFTTGIVNMPILPFLSDSEHEIEEMVKAAEDYWAHYLLYSGLTLYGDDPEDCKTLYFNFLMDNYPDLLSEYEKLFKRSFASSKRYQRDLAIRYNQISSRHGIRNSIIN